LFNEIMEPVEPVEPLVATLSYSALYILIFCRPISAGTRFVIFAAPFTTPTEAAAAPADVTTAIAFQTATRAKSTLFEATSRAIVSVSY
jgi:hypothetical protein